MRRVRPRSSTGLTALTPPEPVPADRVEELLSTGGVDAVLEEVIDRWQSVTAEHDVIVAEGLNPGPTQIYSSRLNQAMAKALDAEVVLVGSGTVHRILGQRPRS